MADASRNRVDGVLCHQLASVSSLPTSFRREAEQRAALVRLSQFRLQRTLDEALAVLDAAHLRAVALKGPVFAERVYPAPSLRPSLDLDFLVAPEELDRAAAVLANLGYQLNTSAAAQYERRHGHHIRLLPSDPLAPEIELHFRAHTGFGTISHAQPLLQRASPYLTQGHQHTWVLAAEDEFLYLAIHAAGHTFRTLSLLYDLKLFLLHYPQLDWQAVRAAARTGGTATALAYTCELLRQRLEVARPTREEMPPPRPLRWRVATALLAASGSPPGSRRRHTLVRLGFQTALCDRPTLAGRLLWRRLAQEIPERARRRRT
jgi:hypothetical protein